MPPGKQHSWTQQDRLSSIKLQAAPLRPPYVRAATLPADPVVAGIPLSQLRQNPQPAKPPLSNFASTEPLALLTGYKSPDAFAILGLEPHLYPTATDVTSAETISFFNSSLSSDSRKERFFSPLNNSPHETTYSVVIMRPKNTAQRK